MANKCPKCQTNNPEDSKFCKECATPLPHEVDITEPFTKTLETPVTDFTRGSTFAGRYEIIEELGKGGMGKVYRVEDKKIRQEIALKLIKPEIALEKKTIERFKNELTIARKIRHKNVCAMFDLGEEKGQHYITMEYISGQDLKGLIRQTGQLTVGKATSIAEQICNGLEEAHNLGIVHRDLKPNNIMIDRGGNARIMDFGIARAVKGKSITGSGVMIGTPQYMSPEQVEGKEVDQRSDIYSLGIILYEMLTDRVPFEGETPLTVGVKQKTETPKDPKDFNERISDDLNQLILRCLEKEKENRYRSVGEVRSELVRLEQGLPTTDRVIPKKKTLTSKEFTVTFGMKKVFIPILAIIALAVISLFIWKPWLKKETIQLLGNKPSLAVMYFINGTGDTNYDSWEYTIPDSLITALSQSKYIRVLGFDHILSILRKLDLADVRSYDRENLFDVVAAGEVSHIVRGTLSKSGDRFRINYQLQDMIKDEIVNSGRVEGEGEGSLFTMVDELTNKIKENFDLTEDQIAADENKTFGEITTNSVEALGFYMKGRRLHNQMDPIEAIRFYQLAVEIDPEFAMAYRFLGSSLEQIGFFEKGQQNLQKAFELSGRLPERERLHIHARFYLYSDRGNAIKLYKRILDDYPDDLLANINLGGIYFEMGELEMGISRTNTAIQYKSHLYAPYHSLACIYSSQGQPEKAKVVIQTYVDRFGELPITYQTDAIILMREGKYNLALMEIEKAISIDPSDFMSQLIKGDIYLYQDNLISAEKEYRKLFEIEDLIAKVSGYVRLISLESLQGRFKAARNILNELLERSKESGDRSWAMTIWRGKSYIEFISGNPNESLKTLNTAWDMAVELDDLDEKIENLHQKGILYLSTGSLEEAESTAGELKQLVEQAELESEKRFYSHLKGKIEIEKRNFSLAIDYLKKALEQKPVDDTYYRAEVSIFLEYSLATAYHLFGDLEKALEEYEKILKPYTVRFGYGLSYEDLYARIFYMIGKIYEQQGENAKAIEHYEKFLSLWITADPGLPEVDDAKERLAGLRGEQFSHPSK